MKIRLIPAHQYHEVGSVSMRRTPVLSVSEAVVLFEKIASWTIYAVYFIELSAN